MKHIKAIVNNCIKKQDNRGFSLVEMVAALVIMSLIGLGVGGLIVSGSKYFRRSTAETELQEEAQLVKNYLNNMVVDTALAIGRIDNFSGTEPDNGDSCVFVCAPEEVRIIKLETDTSDDTKKRLWYVETTLDEIVDEDTTTGKKTVSIDNIKSLTGWEVLSEHVKSFDVSNSLKNIKKNQFRIFNCAMEFEVRERTYKTKHTINLRNDIFEITDADLTKAYEYIDIHKATVTGVVIDPVTASASRSGEFQFHSYVQGLNFPAQAVEWKVSGYADFNEDKSSVDTKSTIDKDGLLKIASDETFSVLYVRATSVLDDKHAANAIVRIATLNGADIYTDTATSVPNEKDQFDIGKTVTLGLEPDVTFVGDDGDASASSLGYAWDIVDIYIPVAETEDEYIANLPKDEKEEYHIETKAVAGSRLKDRVIVTPKGDKCEFYITNSMPPNCIIHVTGSVTMSKKTVVADNAPYEIKVSDKYASGLDILTDHNIDTLNRKGKLAVRGRVANQTGAAITWEIVAPPYLKGKVGFDEACKVTTTTSISGEDATAAIYLYANNSIDYTLENLEFELKATYENSLTNQVLEERKTIKILPVKIVFEPISATMVVGIPLRVRVTIQGLEADADDITFKSTKYVKNLVGPIYSAVNKNLVISVTPPEAGKSFPREQDTEIRAAMKSSPKVTGTLKLNVFKSNIIVPGKDYCYVPEPNDPSFPLDTNRSGFPKDNESVTTGGADGVTYVYFVEGNRWGVIVQDTLDKFYYENGTFKLQKK